MKLKTFKNWKLIKTRNIEESVKVISNNNCLREEEIKQQVIKHIKSLRNESCDVGGVDDSISVILYLKYLFNLTDEEIGE